MKRKGRRPCLWLGLTVPWTGAGPAPLSTITVISTLNDVLTRGVSSYGKYFQLDDTENISLLQEKTCDRTPSQLGKKFKTKTAFGLISPCLPEHLQNERVKLSDGLRHTHYTVMRFPFCKSCGSPQSPHGDIIRFQTTTGRPSPVSLLFKLSDALQSNFKVTIIYSFYKILSD